MSANLSAEEKKRLLRERRQKKMSQGKASDRLNLILGLGLSVKADLATLVLDKPLAVSLATDTTPHSSPNPETTQVFSPVRSNTPDLHGDPADIDISKLSKKQVDQSDDIDEIFSNLMGGVGGANHEGGNDMNQMLSNMLKGGPGGFGGQGVPPAMANALPEEIEYNTKLTQYQLYQAKKLKFQFLVVRYAAILGNFVYHFVNHGDFIALQLPEIRQQIVSSEVLLFFQIFLAIEAVVVLAWYVVLRKHHLSGEGGLILKGFQMALMFLPQLEQYRPLITQLLGYWLVLGVIFGDLSLVMVLFGLLSVFG